MKHFDIEMHARNRPKVTVKNWKRADWASIKQGLSNTEWPTTDDDTTVEAFWQQLRAKITELTNQHVPLRTIRPRKADWVSNDILQLIRKKRRLWKKAKYGQAVAEYEAVSKELKRKIRSAKRTIEKKLANTTTNNKRPFYNYVKKKTRSSEGVGPLKSACGETITDEAAMAEELNHCFSNVFTREDGPHAPASMQIPTRTKLQQTFIYYTKSTCSDQEAEKNQLSRTCQPNYSRNAPTRSALFWRPYLENH
jgi:hypothetical protein